MKQLLFITGLLLLAGCTSARKTTTAETTNSNAALQARVRNNSTLEITRFVIYNESQGNSTYNNIKAHKTSAYQPVNYLCSCGYNIEIEYKDGDKRYTVKKDCVNIMPCNDPFKGKLLIDVKGTNPATKEVDLSFKKD